MYAYYDYIQAGGTLSYQNWYNYRYNVPLKDETLVLYLCVLVYMSLKKIKQQKNRDVPYITKLSKNVYLEKIDK